MRTFGLLLALVLLVGCATPQITIPAGQAAVAFGQVRADYAVAKVIIMQGCMGGKIDKDSCDALTAIDTRATIIRVQVERALMDARSPVDWAQVMSYAATVSEMLIKLGVLAVK